MSDENIVEFGRPREVGNTPKMPDNLYIIQLRSPEGGPKPEPIRAQGYLSLTGAFFAVCQGPGNMPDVQFVAPIENYDYCMIDPATLAFKGADTGKAN